MDAEQMRYEFEVGYDRITNFDAPGYTPKEISTFLTKSQEETVLDIYTNPASKEFNKKILSVLKTYTSKEGGTSSGIYPNSDWIDVPTKTFLIINERADITGIDGVYDGRSITDVEVVPVDDDYYHANKNNPFKKPNEKRIWRLDYGQDDTGWKSKLLYVYNGDYQIGDVHIHYYRKPEPIIVPDSTYLAADGSIDGIAFSSHTVNGLDSELDPIIHREIVDRAVKLAFAALQDEKGFQLSSIKEQQK